MIRTLVAAALLSLPAAALACGGNKSADTTAAATDPNAAANPAACAKKAELVGSGCSHTTGMMAQRVLAEGAPYTYAGTLVKADSELTSHVAAPFVVGPDKIRVVANEVLEGFSAGDQRVSLEGKLLEVDGVKYFVLTQVKDLRA